MIFLTHCPEQWYSSLEVVCTTRLSHRETLCWTCPNASGWAKLKHCAGKTIASLDVSENIFTLCLFLSISLRLKTAIGTGASITQRGTTGWTGPRRNMMYVSLYLNYFYHKWYKMLMAVHHSSSDCLHVETPHCSNQNGSEGPLFIHPTANVLDPVWPKGTLKSVWTKLAKVALLTLDTTIYG